MKKIIFFLLIATYSISLSAQEIVTWQFEYSTIEDNTLEIVMTATVHDGWYMYSLTPGDGPMPTTFSFVPTSEYELVGDVTELHKPIEKFDEGFGVTVKIFEYSAVFVQKIKRLTDKAFVIQGSIMCQTCSGMECMINESEMVVPVVADATPIVNKTERSQSGESFLGFILAAILAGLACILTPCVFPMIPMTVGFFISGSKKRALTVAKAFVFWLSVGVVYGVVGCIIAIFKSDGFAQMISSHWIPNLIFALMFITFAASFFGMFEITLPTGMANRADRQVDKGGIVASFFMAIVLAVVSFSCTGPFVGSLIAEAARGTAVVKPILGFVCFGLAMGAPFLIFTMFPSVMKKLPKSGGWLNAVKVVFAFIMLGFSLKFIVQVDSYLEWNLISSKVGIGFWIVLSILLGMYLLGKIKFSHDSDIPYVSVPRLLFAIVAFTFGTYLLPGLFGSDLEVVSSFLPASIQTTENQGGVNYSGIDPRMTLPDNISGYFDLNEAIEQAKEVNKPILIDFTGIFCSNCKKMKATAFKDPRVVELINTEFVFVALYTDVKTVGKQNAAYQLQKFGVRSQPYFAVIDSNENILAKGLGYADADKLLDFLRIEKSSIQ
ncbi:MAG: thioredoxin fold domain-containing protein [Prevotellaceae bacterium]|nr:thioredoxin fold domain-containing protein [Prevotellaceae bacterium]